jgi:hypothetical protein
MSDLSTQSDRRPASPADDLIWGCDAIANVLGINRERVYYLIKTKAIPVSRINKRTIVASRRKLMRWAAEVLAA